jgi:hypothetical protein
MSTAAAYINKVRVQSIARNTKVEYPGRVAKNIEPLAATCASILDFTVLDYKNTLAKCRLHNVSTCIQPSPPPEGLILYIGGNEGTESTNLLSGGNEGTESTNVLSGGNV